MCKIADWIVFLLLSMCSISDFRKKTIPLVFLVILNVVVVCLVFVCNDVEMKYRLGGVFMGLLFLLISRFTREAIGYGDSWLILLLGIHMGYLGAISVLFLASLLAGFASLLLLWRCNWKRKATIPFVPFLTISYLGAILL